jgi:RNA polymerase sigma-70 factor, ECF subfamily
MGGALSREPNAPVAEHVRELWRAGRVEEARLELVHATMQSVYRFLKAMVRDEDVAQDLTQDTFVRAFQSLGSFRAEAQLTTWILTIARNLALNRARRMKLESRWNVATDHALEIADPRAASEPGDRRLMAALAELPLPQREAVVLYYLEDLGVDEVARQTGRPANTIKSDLHRARATLRAVLPGHSETEALP